MVSRVNFITALIALQLFVGPVSCARILAVFPCPSKSHLVGFTALTSELALRGHELVVVSPFPISNPPANYTDINIFPDMKEFFDEIMGEALYEMIDMWTLETALMFWMEGIQITETTLGNSEVKELLNDRRGFDLVIVEDFMTEPLYAFASYFKAPLILISSLGGLHSINYAMGNPIEMAYCPNNMLQLSDRMTLLERMQNILFNAFWDAGVYLYYMPKQEKVRKQFFGESTPSVWEVRYSASLALLNSHYSINFPRPQVPAIQEVGGMHIRQTTQPLPKDIQSFLDDAKEGAIYFSFGSNIRINAMPAERLTALLAAFAELPQRVLMKWESDSLPGQPANVKIMKWLPQQDILAHPNVRVFFTHGGLLSIQEATFHGVPLVGTPIFGDQMLNIRKAERDGYAVMLELKNITKSSVMWAVNKVLHSESMHMEMKRRSSVYRDQLQTPLERAVYWVEYVLRHRGASHLRSAALELSWYQIHLLDVIFILILAIYSIVSFTRHEWKLWFGKPVTTPSTKKEN